MQTIPLPEIVVVLVVAAILEVGRRLAGIRPFPFVPRPGDLRLRQPPMTNAQLRARIIASDVFIAIISVPLIIWMVPPNGVYGFRVSATRDPAIWYPANAFMGWALLVAAVMSATALLRLPEGAKRWLLWAAFLLPVTGALVASFVYLGRLRP